MLNLRPSYPNIRSEYSSSLKSNTCQHTRLRSQTSSASSLAKALRHRQGPGARSLVLVRRMEPSSSAAGDTKSDSVPLLFAKSCGVQGTLGPASVAFQAPYAKDSSMSSERTARASNPAAPPLPMPSLNNSRHALCVALICSAVYPLRLSPSKFTPCSWARSPLPRMHAGTSPSTMDPPARKANEPTSQNGQTATAPPKTAPSPTCTWPASKVLLAMMFREPTTQSCAMWQPPMMRLPLPKRVTRSAAEDRWIWAASRMSLLFPISKKHSSPFLYLRSWHFTPTKA
mmetsp:Transcript_38599/g.73970  ORF Transcript_38599/g.73970 Transcript_38599/m.73970 type:complete len:286 (+) Transcript_38599:724-1581(+)